MLETHGSKRWNELLGVNGKSIRWSYAAAFVVVYIVSAVSGELLDSTVRELAQGQWAPHWEFLRSDLANMFISMPLAALCIVAGFRILRQWMAVILTPLAYTILVAGTVALRNGTLKMTNDAWSLAATLACYRYCFYFFFLLGVILALRWIKSPWVALALGSWLASLPPLVVMPFGAWLLRRASFRTLNFDINLREQALSTFGELLADIVWAGLLWVGLEIASAARGRVSKPFYLISTVGGLQIMATLLLLLPSFSRRDDGSWILGLMIAFVALGIYCSVVMFVWLYKMWDAIQDGHARATPGQAVGFIFIPFFNLYWIFRAFWGFAEDCNQYLDRHALSARKLSTGVFLAYTIVSIFGGIAAIPVAGYLVISAQSILGAIMIVESCDTVNMLPLVSVA